MKAKIGIIAIIMSMLIILSGCSSQQKPEKVVKDFTEAMKSFDLEEMSSKVNPKDSEGKEMVSNFVKKVQ